MELWIAFAGRKSILSKYFNRIEVYRVIKAVTGGIIINDLNIIAYGTLAGVFPPDPVSNFVDRHHVQPC
jgi:hypothetical protein